MTKWFLPNPKRRPPKTTEWKLDIPPCEEIDDMQKLIEVKGKISDTVEEMFSAVTYYRWMLRKYQKRAVELCLLTGEHEYEKQPYDPYSPMICVKCHHERG
jgi:hypothetical protein